MLSDFQTFELYDLDPNLDERTHVRFALHQLHEHVEDFAFILGVQKRTLRDQDPVNIEASELMGQLLGVRRPGGALVRRELSRTFLSSASQQSGPRPPQAKAAPDRRTPRS